MRSGATRAIVCVLSLLLVAGCSSGRKPVANAQGDGDAVIAEGGQVPTGTGDPTVVAGGVGPSVTGGAAALPTAPSVTTSVGGAAAVTTTLVTGPAPRSTPGQPGQPGGQGGPGPPPPPTTIAVPADNDPKLAVWCPLADEVVQVLVRFNELGPPDFDRVLQLLDRGKEFTPAYVLDLQVYFQTVFRQLLDSGKFHDIQGEAAFAALAEEVVGPGSYEKIRTTVLTLLSYYAKNCYPG